MLLPNLRTEIVSQIKMSENYFQGFSFIDSWTSPMATDMTDKSLFFVSFCVCQKKNNCREKFYSRVD